MSSEPLHPQTPRHPRASDRLQAVRALASSSLPISGRLDGLFGALTDRDWRVVEAAWEGIASHRNPSSVEAVLRELKQALEEIFPPGTSRPPDAPLSDEHEKRLLPCLRAAWLVRAEPQQVLPLLLRTLEQGGTSLMGTMRRIFDGLGKPALPRLMDALNAATDSARKLELALIVVSHDAQAVQPLLLTLLRNDRTYDAAWLLRGMGSKVAAIMEDLLALLGREYARLRQRRAEGKAGPGSFGETPVYIVLSAIQRAGEAARAVVPMLLSCLAEEDCPVRGRMLQVLAAIGDPSAEPVLRAHLTHSDATVRCDAASGLHRITGRADEVLPVLRQSLKNRGDSQAALSALVDLGSDAAPAIPWVLDWVEAEGPSYCQWDTPGPLAQLFLAGFPPTPRGLRMMRKRLESRQHASTAIRLLGDWGPAAASAAPEILTWAKKRRRDAYQRCEALDAHWRVSGEPGPALRGLPRLLRLPNALHLWTPGRDLVPRLVGVLHEAPSELRQAAAEVLALAGSKVHASLPALEALQEDADPKVRVRVRAAIECISADF
ncbi:HEAT repeat domain-containing protein [Hyalangium gracile]|uniref:HEAT repeat domain-containing protein n=1 Tax=Hyalangium gracile TaxID=394092 RepID=UPI001CC93894|nr:HEAT repeat domain-containing protein [Hyalangium gracile]